MERGLLMLKHLLKRVASELVVSKQNAQELLPCVPLIGRFFRKSSA